MTGSVVRYLSVGALLWWCTICHATSDTWIAGWQPATPMNTARAGAAVIEAGGVIYAIGGIDGRDFLRSTEYSRIRPDRSLAPWQTAASLNEARGFFAAATHNGYVYVVGGGNGPGGHNLLRSVERARIHGDGRLGAWEIERHGLQLPRRCSKLVIAGDYLYALGGFGGALLDSVERAEILPDGSLGPWRVLDQRLTRSRYITAVQQTGNAVYIVGGHEETGGAGITDVEWTALDGNGVLSDWRATRPLGVGRFGLAAAVHAGRVYALGGLSGATYRDAIETAPVDDANGVGPWRATTPLSTPRANFAAVVYRDTVYVIGGTNRDGYYNRVEMATFNADGDIGFHGTEADARRVRDQRAQPATDRVPPPNEAQVLEVIQGGGYTYVRIAGPGGGTWLAGPTLDVVPGDRVQYSRGVAMGNFFSRSLQRTFSEIRFVERLEKKQP